MTNEVKTSFKSKLLTPSFLIVILFTDLLNVLYTKSTWPCCDSINVES